MSCEFMKLCLLMFFISNKKQKLEKAKLEPKKMKKKREENNNK